MNDDGRPPLLLILLLLLVIGFLSSQHPQSPIAPPEPGDSTSLDTSERIVNTVPATIEIDLGIDPVAYRYESWSKMADGWVESLRSTAMTMPDPDHDQIRNVTPLVSLADVEALVERMILSGEVAIPDDQTDAPGDTSPP
jgi:hypothetical protein